MRLSQLPLPPTQRTRQLSRHMRPRRHWKHGHSTGTGRIGRKRTRRGSRRSYWKWLIAQMTGRGRSSRLLSNVGLPSAQASYVPRHKPFYLTDGLAGPLMQGGRHSHCTFGQPAQHGTGWSRARSVSSQHASGAAFPPATGVTHARTRSARSVRRIW